MRRLLALAAAILAFAGSAAHAQPTFDLYKAPVIDDVPISTAPVVANGSSSAAQTITGQAPSSWADMATHTPGSSQAIFVGGVGGSTQNSPEAVFTASISGSTLTVSACSVCVLATNQILVGSGVPANIKITALGTGTGGTGTYTISPSSGTITSRAMTASNTNVWKKTYDEVNGIDGTVDTLNGMNIGASENVNGVGGALASRVNATRILQVDPNGWAGTLPGAQLNWAWIVPASVSGASPTTGMNLMDLWGTAVAQNRFLFWMASDGGWNTPLILTDHQLDRLLWGVLPGHVQNLDRTLMQKWKTISVADNLNLYRDINPVSSYIPDGSHMNTVGNVFMDQQVFLPFEQGVEGGFPWCADHAYFGNASTAQTFGGPTGITIYCVGSAISDKHFQLLNADGTPSTHFVVGPPLAVSGMTTLAVSRVSATILKQGYYDQILHVWSDRGQHRYFTLRLGIGSVNLCNCDTLVLDGLEPATFFMTNDNQGTIGAPSFPSTATHPFRSTGAGSVPGTGVTGFTFVARLTLDASDQDPRAAAPTNRLIYLWKNPQIRRIASGAIDLFWNPDGGSPVSSNASGTGDGCKLTVGKAGIFDYKTCAASGRLTKWLIGMVDLTGTCQQRTMLIDDADAVVDWDSGAAACTGSPTTISLNPAFTSGAMTSPGTGNTTPILWNSGSSHDLAMQTAFSGKVARLMVFPYAIDFTAGCTTGTVSSIIRALNCTNGTNFSALRSGPGTLTDFSVASSNVVGDGRSIITVAGGGPGGATWAPGHVGTATPYFMLSGNAGDYHHGINAGTANDNQPGEEPGNPAHVGGVAFDVADHRNWQNLVTTTTGLAVSQ
jgi:hypothetical protein